MQKFVYIMMILAALSAGLSAILHMVEGHGFSSWIWQLITITWIGDSFLKEKRIERLTK
jgi:hypothetical protein